MGGRKGGGIRETFIEHLSQACAKEIFFSVHITCCKMENLPPPFIDLETQCGKELA